jgi:hypothetical protein
LLSIDPTRRSPPLTGKAKRLANLIPYKKGVSGNPSGKPKDLAEFGDLLMKEFYKTVAAKSIYQNVTHDIDLQAD